MAMYFPVPARGLSQTPFSRFFSRVFAKTVVKTVLPEPSVPMRAICGGFTVTVWMPFDEKSKFLPICNEMRYSDGVLPSGRSCQVARRELSRRCPKRNSTNSSKTFVPTACKFPLGSMTTRCLMAVIVTAHAWQRRLPRCIRATVEIVHWHRVFGIWSKMNRTNRQ